MSKFPTPSAALPMSVLPDGDRKRIDAGLELALRQLSVYREDFRHLFPTDNTTGHVYKPYVCPGYPDGANVGWTTGLWTGQLWMAYELTGDPTARDIAETHVRDFERRLDLGQDLATHDLGFLYTPSCGAAHRLTGEAAAARSMLRAAEELMTRYLPKAGVIQAWGDLSDPAQRGRIIIDCLMNLPLLRWAGQQTGDPKFARAADSHCERALQHLVRADASSYHTYHFDPETGAPLRGTTHQGHSDQSCWARGQAWGIYGFALNHASAPSLGLLAAARRLADYFLAHLPADGVAYWDLSFGAHSVEPRDSSASAIAACGLLELAEQLPPGAAADHYRSAAVRLVLGLIEHCAGRAPRDRALLLHGVYHKPHGRGVDEACLWGDYFYLEALARLARGIRPHWR